LQDGDEDEPSEGTSTTSPVECRVAYGYHNSKLSRSFRDLGHTDSVSYEGSAINWGWANGPLQSSNYAYSFEMYSEGSDSESGTVVGTMTVGYDGEEAVVTVDAGERLWLKEVQAYVGVGRLPLNENGDETIDPEDYPVLHRRMSLSRSFVVKDMEGGPIYVVTEATVCGVFPQGQGSQGHAGVRGILNVADDQSFVGGLFSSVHQFIRNFF